MGSDNISFIKTKYQKCNLILGLTFAVIVASFLSAGECQAVTLTITANNGSVTATPAKADYSIGEVVELIPKPDTGYCFTGWTGDARGKRLVLNLTMDSNKTITANFDTWQPPIGVPEPEFGIFETYRMYDDPENRNPALTYTQNTEGGFYTHYVDMTDEDCTDVENPYGTVDLPRKKIPAEVPAGSVVEIHGGSYTENVGPRLIVIGNGTEEQPIFIRGVSEEERPEFAVRLFPQGSYIITENIYFNNAGFSYYIDDEILLYGPVDHMSVRHCEFEGDGEGLYCCISITSQQEDALKTDLVIYDNEIHHYGDCSPEAEVDVMGIALGHQTERLWIVDNHIHHNGGDGFQVNSQTSNYIYLGRNIWHDDRENSMDLKGCRDVIVSENIVYNYEPSTSSGGNAIRIEDEGVKDNIWIIYNTVYDSTIGIDPFGSLFDPYVIGNIVYNCDIGIQSGAGWVINNTIYNTEIGVRVGDNIINNIIHNCSTSHLHAGTNASYNLLWQDDEGPITLVDIVNTNGIEADPLFFNSANYDFRLQVSSPAINAGISSGVVQTVFDAFQTRYGIDIRKDIEGNPRTGAWDIGAYHSSDPNNPSPVLQAIGDKSVDENASLTFTINATDPNGEPITYLVQGLPSGATLDSQTGDFSWTPSYTQAGSYQVTFIASDGNSQDSETITITVSNINRAPVFGPIVNQSVNENALLSFSVDATDADGQAITYSVSGLPSGAVFASQTFTWTPSYDQAGTYQVTFTADDGQVQDSETITITVVNVNRAPVLTAISNRTAYADVLLTFTINATDPDGDAITYSAGTLPSGATFTDQDFNWTSSQSQTGSYDVTFIAGDGQLQDSETITITVDVDSLAPTVTNLSPTDESIQVPLNNLITLNITDAGIGIEAKSVKIKVRINDNPNNYTVYFGDTGHYTSSEGDCRRLGTKADYRFVYQSTSEMFYYDQTVTITVNATDLAGNVMNSYSYSFATEMHSFGQNKQVNLGLDNNDRPVTVYDSSGNIWTAWHAGSVGSRDIYVSKLAAGEENFGGTVQLTNNTTDQCNPAVALDSNDKLYVVWQDNREGDWDIYISTSVDGINWSTETRVNDPNDGNQVNPAIVINGQNYAHVVWQDDRTDNQDICIATSSDGFATKTVTQITSNTFDQIEPAIAADSANTIYVVWTDMRNGSNDIYGAASNNPWTNVAIVSNTNNQSSPAIATESSGSILHLLWLDDTSGDNDIYYASSDGLPGSPLTGSSIIDDSSGADQLNPSIVVAGSTDNNLKVFACWQDWRNTDTDLYFAELSAGSGTNVFVDDGGSNADQGEPAIGIGEYNHPYLIWADRRSTNTDIYYAGSTFIEPVALASELITASAPSSTIVGTDPQAITTVDDVSIVVPAGACSYDVAITVTKIANPLAFAAPCLGGYDFGPSGIQFSQPVTITIPYVNVSGSATPYWFNSLTGALSQQGITDIQDIPISSSLHALSFKTTHFTAFYLLVGGGGAAAIIGGGGGGGGCSVSSSGEGNIVEFAIPYIVLAVVMAILKVRDARYRKIRIA